MNSELIKFHKKCKKEYTQLSENFNILFYGYGEKESLVKGFFPKAPIFDCKIDFKEFIKDLKEFLSEKNKKVNDYEFFSNLETYFKGNKMIIIKNFDVNYIQIFRLTTRIKFIGLIDSYSNSLTELDLKIFQIVQRDLTSFFPYKIADEVLNLEESKVADCILIANNVPVKSYKIFKIILQIKKLKKKVEIQHLIEVIKTDFFITNKSSLNNLLSEFYEHNILKKGLDQIIVNLNYSEIDDVILELEK